MINLENSSRRSSDSGTRASLSSNGHPDQLHALSAADLPQEWNYWQDTFPQRVRIGEPHSGCSDVSSEPRKIALILNTTFRPRTAWQLRDHPCLLNPRSTLDRDCHHAPLSNKDTDATKRLSFSTSSRVTSIVVCSQNHLTRADLPFATTGVFHIHPSISHGAAREDLQNEILPLVTLYQSDAITGDANKSANTYSRLQHVFNPAKGLMNILMKEYQRLWNETENLPLLDRSIDFMHSKIHCPSSLIHEDWIRV